jgi:mono/diheme cytochrome c family protein
MNMNRTAIVLTLALATLAWTGAARATVKNLALPPDAVQLKPSALPGFATAQNNCVACHSAEYMLYQPPTSARPYWDAMVKRMKTVFKARIEDADMPVIVDYMVKTYGNEQAK